MILAVSSGGHGHVPQTGALNQTLTVPDLEAGGRDPGVAGLAPLGPSPWHVASHLLPVSPQGPSVRPLLISCKDLSHWD